MTIAKKSTRTFTGKACRKCGGTERYSANANCVWCQKTRIKQYARCQQEHIELKPNPIMAAFLSGKYAPTSEHRP